VATLWIRKKLGNATLETSLVLLLPFTAFLAAEEARASGILAVVSASFLVSANLTLDPKHQYPGAYLTRLQEDGVWPVVDFLLETFVFAYIGLQLKFVIEDLRSTDDPGLGRTLLVAGVLLAAAILLRLAGVFTMFGRWALVERYHEWRLRRYPDRAARIEQFRARRREGTSARRRGGQPLGAPTMKETLLVGWTGMRGILTLAAAAAVPERTASGQPFPGRDAIQAVALIVTLGTLLLQGTTLSWLARRLRLDLGGERAEAAQMRARALAVLATVPGETDDAFDRQRARLGQAMAEREIDEETVRQLIEDLDLRQAARQTVDEP
jgi:NhaP-type Na+/H+ or K+/H+ antiporter